MRFGKTLRTSIYPPWKDYYIDYAKLKAMLREDASSEQDDERPWTDNDESNFSDEILNVQLHKVSDFQAKTLHSLEERIAKATETLQDLKSGEDCQQKGDITTQRLKEVEKELDSILNEVRELKKYSNINYTGFLKIVKKHDRKRGTHYKVRPMLQVRLAKRPFNSEMVYNPLIKRLSVLYFAVRQQLDKPTENAVDIVADMPSQTQTPNGDRYDAYKFWVHPDNLLELKTYVLRHLPSLVYQEKAAEDVEYAANDPTINSLYFDSQQFGLYTQKVSRGTDASTLRLRWYGRLNDRPELVFEQKIVQEDGSSEERKFSIKEKYIQQFISGEYKMEKTVAKMERQGQPEEKIEDFKNTVSGIQGFLKESGLRPVLRANYTRSAFQRPLDDRVRVSIDTDLAFIREDDLDPVRPCRDPNDWHRRDIDRAGLSYPFTDINPGEVSRFPFAVLEIKVKEEPNKKTPTWVQELMVSHLVHKVPRFSKFVHGVATLFEDHVNSLPSWLTEVETDIRKDPETAFIEEEQARAQNREDELVVGSFLGSAKDRSKSMSAHMPPEFLLSSPPAMSYLQNRLDAESPPRARKAPPPQPTGNGKQRSSDDTEETAVGSQRSGGYGTLGKMLSPFAISKLAERTRARPQVVLPPGVTKPSTWIKDSGPLHVEPKVWLANERTYLKWQHICVLLASLAVGLYTAAGENMIAEITGIFYLAIAVFAGLWGYLMHQKRRDMIMQRSGKDFDNVIGPLVVALVLMVALILNFTLKYKAAVRRIDAQDAAAAGLLSFDVESVSNYTGKIELV